MEVNFSKLEVYKPSSEHFFSSFADEPVETENVDSILRMVSSGGVAAGYYSMKQRNQQFELRMLYVLGAVSYTHLTLPTSG